MPPRRTQNKVKCQQRKADKGTLRAGKTTYNGDPRSEKTLKSTWLWTGLWARERRHSGMGFEKEPGLRYRG